MKRVILFCIAFVLLLSGYAQVKIGEKAPEIFLDEVYNGGKSEMPTLKNLEGNVVVLYFWATWCRPCVNSFPKINELHKKYENGNVKIIAITDDTKEKLENFLTKANAIFLIGRDDSKKSFTNYDISGRPTAYIINKQGIVVYQGYSITEDLIEEILATDKIAVSSNSDFSIKDALEEAFSFSMGEDPLYNVFNRLYNENTNPYKMIDHFIIRPSALDVFVGRGYKNADQYRGVTYIGGNIAEIVTFLRGQSSTVWVKNNTQDTNLYDIIYWRKAKNIEQAYQEIEQRLSDGLSFKINTVAVEENVNIVTISQKGDSVKAKKDISSETTHLYLAMDYIISLLEEKSGKYFMADNSTKNTFVYNNEMDWEKLYNATAEDLTDFLKSRGIGIRVEKRKIKVLELIGK